MDDEEHRPVFGYADCSVSVLVACAGLFEVYKRIGEDLTGLLEGGTVLGEVAGRLLRISDKRWPS